MKAITLRQPWAWLALHGKDFENRNWRTGFRGNCLLHAGLSPDKHIAFIRSMPKFNRGIKIPDELDYGGIIGVIRLGRWTARTSSIWSTGAGGYPIEASQVLPFTEYRGSQGFWNFPDDIYMQLLNRAINRGGEDEHPDPEGFVSEWAKSGFSGI